MIEVRELKGADARRSIESLAEVLLDCVRGGASVSFMADLSPSAAASFFKSAVDAVDRGERILLAAFIESQLVGTVQVITATPPNQPHRADIAKLLVMQAARGQGVAIALMKKAEEVSRRAAKTLLVLDTVTGGSAEQLYMRLGWMKVGVIPNYALFPDGRPCDTTIFFKDLSA